MDLKRLSLALATTANIARREVFAIGSLVTRTDDPQVGPDVALSLIEALAYLGDVLSAEQDQVADEDFLETSYDSEDDVVRIRLLNDLRPVVFVVVDDERAFVVVIGSEAGDATVRFGNGEHGERPPAGLEDVIATYRHGAGRVGSVKLRGLHLGKPFAVIAIGDPGTRARRMNCSIVR